MSFQYSQTGNSNKFRSGTLVLNTFIDAINCSDAVNTITSWATNNCSKTVCLCNVHSCVTAYDNNHLSNALASSDLVLPDGSPIAWVMRRKTHTNQRRVAGPDLMLKICEKAQKTTIRVCLFGSSKKTLQKLKESLLVKYPTLNIVGTISPKFGKWGKEEEEQYIRAINNSGANIIFVGLGCPKQEIWMIDNKDRIQGVLLGVGAAFDFHAFNIKRAPLFLQNLGLEWLHRLASEPKRLWKRYLITNSRFIWLIVKGIHSNN